MMDIVNDAMIASHLYNVNVPVVKYSLFLGL